MKSSAWHIDSTSTDSVHNNSQFANLHSIMWLQRLPQLGLLSVQNLALRLARNRKAHESAHVHLPPVLSVLPQSKHPVIKKSPSDNSVVCGPVCAGRRLPSTNDVPRSHLRCRQRQRSNGYRLKNSTRP
ncbi:hypothetical protein NPIL_44671 [Nephila pilipes]|uniref:Uncharacterized protein n=1 Tax=Nephila pilipes TaxID=299642 RepID=A0A8X6NSU0_NEPPI|nr:hypothetical protein NPIL_44671 [Nephila pilipes]